MKFKSQNENEKEIENKEECCKNIGILSDELINLLVRQLQHELYNHNLYRSIAAYFANKGYSILEKYYIARADEEKHHHDWIVNYLNENGIDYAYPEIPSTEDACNFENMVEPFELTVEVEEITTKLIYEMVDLTQKEHDWMTFAWLIGKDEKRGYLVLEQSEELSLSKGALDIAKRDDSWTSKSQAIMQLYMS